MQSDADAVHQAADGRGAAAGGDDEPRVDVERDESECSPSGSAERKGGVGLEWSQAATHGAEDPQEGEDGYCSEPECRAAGVRTRTRLAMTLASEAQRSTGIYSSRMVTEQ